MVRINKDLKSEISTPTRKQSSSASNNKHGTSVKAISQTIENSIIHLSSSNRIKRLKSHNDQPKGKNLHNGLVKFLQLPYCRLLQWLMKQFLIVRGPPLLASLTDPIMMISQILMRISTSHPNWGLPFLLALVCYLRKLGVMIRIQLDGSCPKNLMVSDVSGLDPLCTPEMQTDSFPPNGSQKIGLKVNLMVNSLSVEDNFPKPFQR